MKKKKKTFNVTADLVIDLFLESQKLPEKRKEEALKKIKLLSKNIGKDITIDF